MKFGKGYEAPWLVFRGADVDGIKAKIAASFGMESASVAELTLADVISNASKDAVTVYSVSSSMGGTVIGKTAASKTEAKPAEAKAGSHPETSPAWEPPTETAAPEAEVANPLLARIEDQTTVSALQKLWGANKATFDADAALMDAYKVKGKALQAAGAL